MKLQRMFIGLSLPTLLGSALLLTACGTGTSASANTQAKQQFLNDRGANGTPGPTSGTPGTGTGAFAGRAPGAFGTIESINGNKITIKNQTSGAETTLQLNNGAPVLKQVAAQASDIKVGETVTATGTRNGDVVEAQSVQIGTMGTGAFGGGGGRGAGGGFNGTPGSGRQGSANGTPVPNANPANGAPGAQAQGTPGVPRAFVSGTVTGVSGNTITVNSTNGTAATFTISSSTRLQKQESIQLSDLKVGDNIVAAGQQNGDTFNATTVQVMTGLGFPGGQGGAGRRSQPTPTPTP